MKLGSPAISRHDDLVRVEARLESGAGTEVLWYDFDARFADALVTNRLDGFAVVALLIAMERGERELVIEGALSERLFHNLTQQVVPILRIVSPELRNVAVRPDALDNAGRPSGKCVVTGFSGGIDAFCTIADYTGPDSLPGYRLTHLLFCNVGGNGRGDSGERIYLERWNLIKGFAEEIGLEMVRVNSNLDDFVRTRFEGSHPLRNSSVVLLLQGVFGKFLYSSGFNFKDSYVREKTDLAHADPALIHQLSTESLEIISTGAQLSRIEKTRRAITIPQTRQRLNVCVLPLARNGRNCSKCVKCLRTLATLDLLGKLDEFDQVFDVDAYKRRRDRYLMMLPARTSDALIREILELTREPGVRLEPHVAAFHAMWPVLKVPYGAARAVKHAIERLQSIKH